MVTNINKLLKKSDFLYKMAGILPYPPKMKEEVLKIVKEAYAAYQNSKQMSSEKLINIDLTGLPPQYSKLEKELADSGYSILVSTDIVEMTEENKFKTVTMGSWNPHYEELNVKLIIHNGKPFFDRIEDIVEHELIHMMQTLIEKHNPRLAEHSKVLKTKPGYPSEWKPSKQEEVYSDAYRIHGRHYLSSGVEFFSQLRNNIEIFKKLQNKTKYDFLRFVNGTEFFVNLKLEKPKLWERAVKEAWKELSDDFNTDPEKELEAKNDYDSWNFMSKNKVKLLEKANSMGFDAPFSLQSADPLIQEAFKHLLHATRLSDYSEDQFVFLQDARMDGINFCIVQNGEIIPLIVLLNPK